MVSHEIVIQKRKAGGMKDNALDWIISNLNNKKLYTKINTTKLYAKRKQYHIVEKRNKPTHSIRYGVYMQCTWHHKIT